MRGKWEEPRIDYNPELYDVRNVAYGEDPMQTILLALPKGKKNFPVVLWLHGGGLTGGEREYPSQLWNGELASAEIRYRLSDGRCRGTDSLADAVRACAWALDNIAGYGGDVKKIFLGGMSAGTYLAAMAGMAPHLLAAYSHSHREFAGLLLVSGQMTTHFQIKADLQYKQSAAQPVIDELAPLYYAAPDIPPVIFVTGESGRDMAARPEENAFFAATLRALGHRDAEHFALAGHDHSGAFAGCDWLLSQFIAKILQRLDNE